MVTATDLTSYEHIERELMLVKLSINQDNQADIIKQIDYFSGKIVDASEDTYTIELAGQSKSLDAFIELLDESLIIEVSRTGVTGVLKGTNNN